MCCSHWGDLQQGRAKNCQHTRGDVLLRHVPGTSPRYIFLRVYTLWFCRCYMPPLHVPATCPLSVNNTWFCRCYMLLWHGPASCPHVCGDLYTLNIPFEALSLKHLHGYAPPQYCALKNRSFVQPPLLKRRARTFLIPVLSCTIPTDICDVRWCTLVFCEAERLQKLKNSFETSETLINRSCCNKLVSITRAFFNMLRLCEKFPIKNWQGEIIIINVVLFETPVKG